MTHIAHLIKTSSLVRIFLVVVLSLGMAWLIGSGLKVQSATSSTNQSVSTSSSSTSTALTSGTATDTQSSAAASNTSLDKAVRLLGGVDRDRNSTGSSNIAKTTNTKTDTNAAANSGTTSKLGTGSVPVVPAK